MTTIDTYPKDVTDTLLAGGWYFSETGGGIKAWAREDQDRDLFVYLRANNPAHVGESSAGIDVMSFGGDHRYSRNFDTLQAAIEYTGRMFNPDSRERFRQDMIRWLQRMDRNGDFDDESTAWQGMQPITVADGIEIGTDWAKDGVSSDVRSGRVPVSVASFAQLHDYVDANEYGGAELWPVLPSDTNDDAYQQAFADFWNAVQGKVDQWIKSGQMRQEFRQSGQREL